MGNPAQWISTVWYEPCVMAAWAAASLAIGARYGAQET